MDSAEQPIRETGMSKLKLAMSVAGLFLFIVGLKRTFEMDDQEGIHPPRAAPAEGGGRKEE
jgi:hypothetical protein